MAGDPAEGAMRAVDRAVLHRSQRPLSLKGRLVARASLCDREQDAMFRLLGAHFEGVDADTFSRDLKEKNWVILLEDEEGTLRGFSTLLMYDTSAAGRPLSVVYSGDTIVEPAAWGTSALPRTWIHSILALREQATTDLHWLLITSGYRTYRFLPVFFRSFFPRAGAPIDAGARTIVDCLAAERFGRHYDRATGVIRFSRPQVLTDGLLAVPEGRRLDPHVAFFLARNPGYVRGDELVCLTEIVPRNLTAAADRMVREHGRG